jgi:Cu/Ag efflux protein CusF
VAALTAALAQSNNPVLSNVIPQSAAVTLHAKIRAINPETREITLAGRSGTSVTVQAGAAVRLDMLRVGDTVNAQYYRSVAFMLSAPGLPTPEDQMEQAVLQSAQAPGGIGVRETKITGLVVGVDLAAHSIDIVNPSGGGIYTINVTDPSRQALLETLKVGDTITAVVSQALAVSITPAPESWF